MIVPWIWPPAPRFPASLPPNGPAGGDLAGTYPNPTLRYVTVRSGFPIIGNPYIDPPASPNAFNDEFFDGSPDLSLRPNAYTVKTAAGVTLTRSGEVQPWDTAGPVGNTYWSSIQGSMLLFQGPSATNVVIFCPITLAVGDSYFCRVGGAFRYDSTVVTRFVEFGFYQNLAGMPDVNNRIYVSNYEDNVPNNMHLDMARSTGGAVAGPGRLRWYSADIRGVRYGSAPNNYNPFIVDSHMGENASFPTAGAINAANVAWLGLWNTTGAAGGTPTCISIDCFRKVTGNKWIVGP